MAIAGTKRVTCLLAALAALAVLVGLAQPVNAYVANGDPNATDPEGDGSWGPVLDFTIMPIHSMVLPNGKVLTFGTDEFGIQGGNFVHTLYDPKTNQRKVIPNTTRVNIFCSNMAIDPATGEVVIMGGDQYRFGGGQWSGIKNSVIFDPVTETIRNNERGNLNFARWYGTVTTLSNGEIFMVGGRDERYIGSTIPEIYNSATGFRTLPGAEIRDFRHDDGTLRGTYWYTYLWQASDGDVWVIESEGLGAERSDMHRVDPRGQGSVQTVGKLPFDTRNLNAGLMFDVDKVVIAANDGWLWVGDLAPEVPTWTRAVRMENARTNGYLVPLPDGRVAAVGGSSSDGLLADFLFAAQRSVFVWDPETNTTEQWAQSNQPRMYHSSSLLLPNATILAAGGGAPGPLNLLNGEVFTPPYLFGSDGRLAERPRIVGAPSNIRAGETFRLRVDDSASIDKVSVIRSGAATHARNSDARFLALDFRVIDGRTIEVTTPDSNRLPPGLWMLFTVDTDGVPSDGSLLGVNMINLPEATPLNPPPTVIYGIDNRQIDGAFQATVEVRFDDVARGAGARVFDLGNGPLRDNIWLGQVGNTTDLSFGVVRDGAERVITARNVIVEDEIQRWTVSVDNRGVMRLLRDGQVLAEGQGVVPADVDRSQNLIGASSQAPGVELFGLVRNLQITNLGPGEQPPPPPNPNPPPPPPSPDPSIIASLPTTPGDDDIVVGEQITLTGATSFGAGRNRFTAGRYFNFTGDFFSMSGSTGEATMNLGFGAEFNDRPLTMNNGGARSTLSVDGYSRLGPVTMNGSGAGTVKSLTFNTSTATTGSIGLNGSGTLSSPLTLDVNLGQGVDIGGDLIAAGSFATKTLQFNRNVNIGGDLNLDGFANTVTATIGDGLQIGGAFVGSSSGTDRITIGDGWSIGTHLELRGGNDTLILGHPAEGTAIRVDGGPATDSLSIAVLPGEVAAFEQAARSAGWTATGATTWNASGRTMTWKGLSLVSWESVTVITTNLAPVVTNPGPQTSTVGQPIDLVVSAIDPEGTALSWSAQNLPSGLLIDPVTGRITGTPAVPGLSSVIVGASDGELGGTASFNWTITPAAGSASVGGVVTDTAGAAVAGVTVDLFSQGADGERSQYLESSVTGADGRVTFTVPAGCYVTVAIAPSGRTFTSGSRWAPQSGCVSAGEAVTDLDAQLLAGGAATSVGGAVASGDGTPVPGVAVDLFQTTGDGSRGGYLVSTTTDGDGRYRFNVPAGCYWVVFVGPEGEAFVDGRTFDNVSYLQTSVCAAAGETVSTVDAELIGGASLRAVAGSVTQAGVGVDGLVVDLFEATADGTKGRWLGDTSTADGGQFGFERTGGCYVLVAIAPEGQTFVGGSRFAERSACIIDGQAPGPVEFQLAVPLVG